MMRARLLLVVLLALPSTFAAQAPSAGGRLRGEVQRDRLRDLPGVAVLAVCHDRPALAITRTDRRGAFAFDGLPEGDWSVIAASGGREIGRVDGVAVRGPFRAVADVRERSGEEPALALELPGGDGPCRLAVRTVDPRHEPLAAVRVELVPVAHRADPVVLRTGDDGRAAFESLACGTWRIVAGRAGWTTISLPRVSWPSGELQLLVRLMPVERDTPPPLEELLPPAELLVPTTERPGS